nr:hypothetical protein [Streptomyces antibioticus]
MSITEQWSLQVVAVRPEPRPAVLLQVRRHVAHAPDHGRFIEPFPMACPECGASVKPLLTIDGYECGGGSRSWWPGDDTASARPTHLNTGRDHAHQRRIQ